jgi:large conductance mechanosensitive channel
MSSFVKEFKDFISRGNVVDLAVAVVIGAAFLAVVNSFVDDILLQIVAAIVGEPNFNSLSFGLGDASIRYGAFLTVLLNFVIVGFAVFLVVKGINAMHGLRKRPEEEVVEAELTEIELLTQIRDSLRAERGGPAV